MDISVILSFLGVAVMLTLMPGPDNIFVLTESLTQGRKNGYAVSVGLSLGVLVHTTVAATGLSIIVQQSPLVFMAIKYLGALYLFYLAFMALKEKRTEPSTVTPIAKDQSVHFAKRPLVLMKKGFLMNILNPKVALFFIALLPQFVRSGNYAPNEQMLTLGLVFAIQAVLIFCAIAYLAGTLTPYVQDGRFWKITKWSKVFVLATLGLAILF